jgi:hypothetical protein
MLVGNRMTKEPLTITADVLLREARPAVFAGCEAALMI